MGQVCCGCGWGGDGCGREQDGRAVREIGALADRGTLADVWVRPADRGVCLGTRVTGDTRHARYYYIVTVNNTKDGQVNNKYQKHTAQPTHNDEMRAGVGRRTMRQPG